MIRPQGPAPLNCGSDDTLDLSVDLARAMVHGSTTASVGRTWEASRPRHYSPHWSWWRCPIYSPARPRSTPLTLTSLSRSHSLSPLPPLPQLAPKSRVCSASLYLCISPLLPIIRVFDSAFARIALEIDRNVQFSVPPPTGLSFFVFLLLLPLRASEWSAIKAEVLPFFGLLVGNFIPVTVIYSSRCCTGKICAT